MYLDLDAERARSLLLGAVWRDGVDVWRDIDTIRLLPAARRLLDAGADPHDLSAALRAAALDAAFALLARLDAGRDVTSSGGDPGWCLVRTRGDDRPTAEPIRGLQAELLALDPSGTGGVDLRR
ncbi:MAG TPA: hypothetical protein VI248_22525 [Kineosporiaceae bacterium]